MGVVKNIICRPFNYAEQNGYLDVLITCVLRINGSGGGRVTFQ